METLQDELSNAMKDFQFEPKMTFKEAGQLEIKNKPEEFRSNDQKETLEIETTEIKDGNSYEMEVKEDFVPKMALEIGQLEIKNKPEEFRGNDQKEILEIETIEIKDENSYEMEVQEDFELQLESDSDDDMNDNEIEPPTMENKDNGKHFLGCSTPD